MLACWPIRIKLLLALAILSAIVSTLALSGFWGLYGFRQLAMNVSERAAELPLSSSLTRSADTLRDTCHRIRNGSHRESLFDEISFRSIMLRNENARFHDALADFHSTLERYSDRLSHSEVPDSLLTDGVQQMAVLNDLRSRLSRIEALQQPELWEMRESDFRSLQAELDLLAEDAERLPTILQQRMAGFRNDVRGQYRTMIILAWSSTIAAIAMVGTLLWLFRTLIMQPFRQLLAGSRRVARGELNHRIDLGTGDELAELAAAMNGMTDRFQKTYDELEAVCRGLDAQIRDRTREVVQREQLASVGFLAAGVAHEINNPLASIAWSAEALESRLHDLLHTPHRSAGDSGECDSGECDSGGDGFSPLSEDQLESLRTNLRRIQEEAFRCKGITERLLDFSRMGDLRKSPTDLAELAEDVVAMVGTLGQYRCKTVRLDCSGPVIANVNPQQIKQVVLNLVTNALESVDTEGAVDVRVDTVGDSARITVEDDGCGMTDEVREHLFEPFFTRRRDGRGTGLGLSITYRIVNQHDGQLTAHSEGPQCGSRLEVLLPLEASSDVDHERLAAA
ncbi:sensor histidine kinase [Candidatus Laterigemmans baculatus]|uniref:sensor histidine kinase n=1 Tax=Candidatus Laterigemmans baculatus TaxID=2770505 RepID=UPI0013DC00DA|nr:HAMP domain-containing sensor histidine kinase [Candidatus Laterigemmans baculatus]